MPDTTRCVSPPRQRAHTHSVIVVDDLDRLRSLQGVKWSSIEPDVLPAWVADMDFAPAEPIGDAIRALVDKGDLGYNRQVHDALVPTWIDWYRRRHGVEFAEAECRAFAGALHALEFTMATVSGRGDGVVVFSPIYYPFRDAIEASGRRIVDVPLDSGWTLDAERFDSAIDSSTRLVLFSQPHNPTGRVFSSEELTAFGDVVERHDLIVVSDEVWCDLVHAPASHVPLVAADERLRDQTVTIGSASKTFNIAGLRCAVAHVGPAAIRTDLDGLPSHFPGGPSSLSAAATIAAWTDCAAWLAETMSTLTERRDHVALRLTDEAPEVGFDPPEATYLGWLDLNDTALGSQPAALLHESARVYLSEGAPFGGNSAGFARLNFATTERILDQILDRVIDAIRNGVHP